MPIAQCAVNFVPFIAMAQGHQKPDRQPKLSTGARPSELARATVGDVRAFLTCDTCFPSRPSGRAGTRSPSAPVRWTSKEMDGQGHRCSNCPIPHCCGAPHFTAKQRRPLQRPSSAPPVGIDDAGHPDQCDSGRPYEIGLRQPCQCFFNQANGLVNVFIARTETETETD